MATSATSTTQSPTNVHETFLTLSTTFLSRSCSLSLSLYLSLSLSLSLFLSLSLLITSLNTIAGSSPVMLNGLSYGKHVLKVVPTGCGRNRMNLKTTITIE